MADEKRRIIYELLVEAKGGAKAKQEVSALGEGIELLKKNLLPLSGIMAGVFVVKGMVQAIEDMQKFNAQLETLGVTGEEAVRSLHSVQDIAVETGQSVADVGKAFAEAVDMQQVMGRSTDAAARSTDAFIKIALAEGKTVADAARYMETLGFAMDSGVLKSKEFIQMLKESNTFQQAAQDALGKTTKELVEMAKQGDIGAVALTKIVLQMEKIGAAKSAITTTQGLTASLKAMFGAIPAGFMEGYNAGKPAAAAEDVGPSTKQVLLDSYRGRSKAVGGLVGAAGTEIKQFYAVIASATSDAWSTSQEEILASQKRYAERTVANEKELAAELAAIRKGFVEGTPWDSNYSKEKREADAKKLAEESKAAEDKAFNRQTSYTFGSSWDAYMKERADAEEKVRQARVKAAQEEAKRLKKIEEDRQKDIWRLQDEVQDNLEKRQKEADKQLLKDLEKPPGLDADIKASLDEANKMVPVFTGTVLYNWDQIDDATAVLEDSFANLFNGGIHSAREFFAMVTQGLANIFAQLAAMQASKALVGWLDDLLGGLGKSAVSAGGNLQGSILDSIGGINAAKGRAFNRGHVIPMASGGIVTGPTVMGLANGTGLMGEAGPEAVMPLRRTSGGKLGVAGTTPSITVVNSLGVQAQARMERSSDRMTLILEAAQMGANLAEARINRSLRSGYGSTAQSVQRTYGLRRRV